MKGRRAPILALLLALLLVLPGCEPLNQALAAPALDAVSYTHLARSPGRTRGSSPATPSATCVPRGLTAA